MFKLGQHIRSKPVGGADAFYAEVVAVMPDGSFIVRDYFRRRRWLRKEHELEEAE